MGTATYAHAHVHDAAPSRDPTGTKTTRLAFATSLQRRWRLLELAVKDVLLERDAFGFAPGALMQSYSLEGRLQAFQSWMDNSLSHIVLGGDRGQWFSEHVLRGYVKGLGRGRKMAESDTPTDLNRYRLLVDAAHVELQGVAEAVSQQTVRAFADGLIENKNPREVHTAIIDRIRQVGITRSKMLASYAVVRAHASGTLDALEAAGVTQVSIQAEHIPAIRIGDRAMPKRKLRTNTRRPVRSGQRRFNIERTERALQKLRRVNVETAGDDKVCPICEEIAEDGPYNINRARGLIPAHLNCRCAFVAVSKALQDHTPGGHEHDQKKHGRRHGVAIDPNQVFYHGTRHEFEEFSHEAQVGRPDGAFYFSPRYQPAENYSTVERGGIPRVIEAKLDIKNAKVMGWDEGSTLFKETVEELKAEGYDGVVMYKSDGSIYEVGVFDPHQVKIQKSTLTSAEAIAARGWNKFKDHTPGGHEHDQKKHGNRHGGDTTPDQWSELYDKFNEAPVTEGIEAAEENWRGGVANFGDRQAANEIQFVEGYEEYRTHLEEAATETLGHEFNVYRYMPADQLEDWKNGASMDPMATSLNRDLAESWAKFAAHAAAQKVDNVVVRIPATPQDILMRGAETEAEIVLNADNISAHTVEVVRRYPYSSKKVKDEFSEDRYNPNQARHPAGTEGRTPSGDRPGGKFASKQGHPGGEYSANARLINGVIHTTNVEDAVRALHENRRVELDQPRGVSIVLDKLANVAEDMIRKGQKAPNYNLCNLTVKGTNLFCVDNLGIPRIKMPQLDYELEGQFKTYLKNKGYQIVDEEQFASHLRATQNELNGVKVAGIARRMREKPQEFTRTLISDDDYILDGHHRWAAQVGNDARNGVLTDNKKISVARVKIGITKLLEEAYTFTGGKGAKGFHDKFNPNQPRWPAGSPEGRGGEFKPLHGSIGHPAIVSSRTITAVGSKVTESSEEDYLQPSLEAMQQDPKTFAQNMELFKDEHFYGNLRPEDLTGTPEEVAQKIKAHISANLEALYSSVPPELRDRTKQWYEGAHRIALEQANKYGLDVASTAGVYAALSPQKDWRENVYLGDRMLDIYHTKQDHGWDKSMTEVGDRIWQNTKLGRNKDWYEEHIKGKSLRELTNPHDKGMWIRTFDQAKSSRAFQEILPEGVRGEYVLANPQKTGVFKGIAFPDTAAWSGNSDLTKAVMAMESGGNRHILSEALGEKHKVRSFYNNILDPWSPNKDVTVDTHAVAAAWLRPYSGTDVAVNHSLATSPKEKLEGWKAAKSSTVTGNQGTYGLYATAYRETADKLGVMPRELQSIVWEASRDIFSSKSTAVRDSVSKIWSDYRNGEITLLEAQQKIINRAK